MAKIKLALLGCGGMSRSHASRFFNLSDRLEVTAVVDVDRAKAEAAAEVLTGAKIATDYREVLDDVEACLLVLPHHLHRDLGVACLEAGKHVLLEKPMANSEAECLDLMAAADASGKTLMIAYCMRFHPLVAKMKELLDAKHLGEVFQVSIWTEQLTRFPADHWASSAATLGGGQLFSHGCHYIDILLWYLGEPVRGFHLGTNTGTPWMEREGTSNVTMEFEGGVMGYHFGTWGARGTRLKYSFHAHCTDGMLEADIRAGELRSLVGDKEEVLLRCEPGKHTENEMAHFLDCLETGAQPFTNAADSLQGLRVIWRMYEAESTNQLADLRGLGLRR